MILLADCPQMFINETFATV